MPWQQVQLEMLKCHPGRLCSRPYDGHPKGCPNYGQRATCPPRAKLFDLNVPGSWWAIWSKFDLFSHVRRMRDIHPDWTDKQCRCCLYWQGTARRYLRDEVAKFAETYGWQDRTDYVEYVPEAHGVNVTGTMAKVGVKLQWPPVDTTVHVAVAYVDEFLGTPPLKPSR